MNKDEAIQAMKEGKIVTHRLFSDNESMTINNGNILLEDGVECDFDEFWLGRFQSVWDNGYTLK